MEEITAEYATETLATPVKLRVKPKVSVACKTDLGRVRENNEDKFEFFIPENEAQLAAKGMIFLVCDGMGGHSAGQIASELACKTFIEVYLGHPSSEPEIAAKSAVVAANRFVLDVGRAIPARRGMGTTLSGLILIQDRALVVQVGDSRVYRLRGGELVQLTVDHTWIEEAIRNQGLSREEAEASPYKHVITRAIGTESDVQPDLDWHELKDGDTFLLCSDGLMNHVSDDQIQSILSSNSLSEASWKLVGEALAGGGSDNTTVLILRVDQLEAMS